MPGVEHPAQLDRKKHRQVGFPISGPLAAARSAFGRPLIGLRDVPMELCRLRSRSAYQAPSNRPPSGFAPLGRLSRKIAKPAISVPNRRRLISQPVRQENKTMYCILDIDLDYFNLIPNAGAHFRRLLAWADRPVAMVVARHNHAFAQWRNRWRKTGIAPSHILHVDEHHDMMDQRQQASIGNFIFHAMTLWPQCRVHWQVQEAIDSPAMWWRMKHGVPCVAGSLTAPTARPGGRNQMLSPSAQVLISLCPGWRWNWPMCFRNSLWKHTERTRNGGHLHIFIF